MATKIKRVLLCKDCLTKFTTKDRRRFKCYDCEPAIKRNIPSYKKHVPGDKHPHKKQDRFKYDSGFNGAVGSLFQDQFNKLETPS